MIVTPMFPALITKPGNIAEHKLVLMSLSPGPIQPQYVIFEVRNPTKSVPKWLGKPNYLVKKATLVVPILSPDGKVILQRWNSFSTPRPMGRAFWNTKDMNFTLFGPRIHLPPLVHYRCLVEKVHNLVEQPHISDVDMIRNSLIAVLKRRMPEESENAVKDEVARVEMSASQAMDDLLNTDRAIRSMKALSKFIKIEVSREIREPQARKVNIAESEPDIVKLLKVVDDDHISTVTALELLKDES